MYVLARLDPVSLVSDHMPLLLQLCEYRGREATTDVHFSVLNLIVRVQRSAAMPLVRRLLSGTGFKAKWYAISLMCDLGDAQDTGAVIAYFKRSLQRGGLRADTTAGTDLSDACGFLDEFLSSESDVEKFFVWLKDRWDRLAGADRRALKRRVPFFDNRKARTRVLVVHEPVGEIHVSPSRLMSSIWRRHRWGLFSVCTFHPRFGHRVRLDADRSHLLVTTSPGAAAMVDSVSDLMAIPRIDLPIPQFEADPAIDQLRMPEWMPLANAETDLMMAAIESAVRTARHRPI